MRIITSLMLMAALLWFALPLQAQQRVVVQAEFFWDNDPGPGNGTPLLVTDGAFDEALETVCQNTNNLPTPGFHQLNIRVKAANGGWGPAFKQVVHISNTSTTLPTIKITAAEYYWDTDPGQGNGTMLLAINGNFSAALETAMATANAPAAGLHTLHIRMRDGRNAWGPTYSMVLEVGSTPATMPPIQVAAAEYFWGSDPGQGNGQPMLALNGNFASALETAIASLGVPGSGAQKISIRVQDAQGNWGSVFTSVIHIDSSNPTQLRPIKLMAAECFWNTDPGQGNGTTVLAFDGNFDAALERLVQSLPTPPVGINKLGLRLQDAGNHWGPVFYAIVEVTVNNTIIISPMQLTAAEYFWNIDPGQGHGTPLIAFNGAFDDVLEKAIANSPSPTVGKHKLCIRVKGDNVWGPVFTTVVDISNGSQTSLPNLKLTTAEYFWDTDPGQGNGTPMLAFNGNFDEMLEKALANAALPPAGFHRLHVRVRDTSTKWGPTYAAVVEVSNGGNLATAPFKITAAEYFWDTDPGQGNGTALLAFNGNFDEAMEQALGTVSQLPTAGFHKLGIRVKDARNLWGPVFSATIEVFGGSAPIVSPLMVNAAEYFWDTDPGQGNGTAMLAFNGNYNKALQTALASTGAPATAGFHKLYIRMRDNKQVWGPAFVVVMEVLPNTNITLPAKQIVAAEYYFDYDPGAGDATPMPAFDGNYNTVIEKIKGGQIPTPVTAGPHTLYMRTKDAANGWGKPFGVVVSIDTTIGFRTRIIGDTSLCASASNNVPYHAPLIAGNTYHWAITGGTLVSGSGTRQVVVNWNANGPHTLRLKECTANGILCDSTLVNIILKPIPTTSIAQTVCAGQSYLGYSVSGTYRDTFPAANGCDSIRTLNLTVLPVNTTTVNISICNGQQYAGHTTAGMYMDTFRAANGCDSIRTLHLAILTAYRTTETVTICQGRNYAGHTVAGTYQDTFRLASGCDSIRTLYLTVLPTATSTINMAICPGGSYLGYSNSGTYRDTFVSATGCDSIRIINLTVKPHASSIVSATICHGDTLWGRTVSGTYRDTLVAANGCDSIRTLNLTVWPLIATTISRTICPGQSFAGYSTPGTYVDTFVSATGCDSIRTLVLGYSPMITSNMAQSICPGQSYLGYMHPGIYRDTFATAAGCDSVRVLTLSYAAPITRTVNMAICPGGSYLGYTQPGTYRDTFRLASGCDSIRTLVLTHTPIITATVNQLVCPGSSYLGYSQPGTYRDTFRTVAGCDSVRILNLGYLSVPRTTVTQTVCFGSQYQGYNQSGTYVDTFRAANGCDSIRTLHLSVLGQITSIVTITACEGETVDGYAVNGIYVDTLVSVAGCDSIRTLHLTIVPQVVTQNKLRICHGDSIKLGNIWYKESGMFRDSVLNASGCYDITVTLLEVESELTVPVISFNDGVLSVPSVYTSYQWFLNGDTIQDATGAQLPSAENGTYLVMVTNTNGCKAISEGFTISPTGADEPLLDWGMNLYPNPTNGLLYLQLHHAAEAQVSLFNSLGQLLQQQQVQQSQTATFDLGRYATGVYYVRAQVGKQAYTYKVSKME